MRQLFKKIMVCFLAIQLVFFTPFANANTSPAGWSFSGFDVVTGIVTAVKNGTKATATVARSPVTAQVAKGILGGIASGAAVGLAISSLIGLGLDAFDWVADPENNAVKWKPKGTLIEGTYADGKQFYATSLDSVCSQWFSYMRTIDGVKARIDSGEKVITKVNTTAKTCQMGTNGTYWWTLYTAALPNDWQPIPVSVVADKIYEQAKTYVPSQSIVVTAVADLTKEGEYDTPLDLSKPEDKTCEAGYVKNSAGECVKKDEPKTCPAGSFKVGDICIEPPEPDEEGDSCGECCDQLLQAISALADLQTALNQKLLDSDDKTRQELVKVQDKIDLLATDLKSINDNIVRLTYEAKKINSTLEQLDENQELRFKNLTDTINQAKKELLDSDKITQDKLDKINEVLNKSLDEFKKTNEKLDKVNENLEKMQKCNETEFNKKMCDMADWFEDKFEKPDENGNIDVKDLQLPSIDTNKVKFDNQCPASTPLDINISSLMVNFHDELNYQPLCDFMIKLRPFVVGFGWVSGAFIVAGVGRKNG